ncbi:hypothetical protein D9Q98_006014 [Chlorella vulgaris]|uniref:Protein TIC 20 n=1 Tax=Chlorella vulgaris TaxID=3077 RepID=A0A9D4TXW4_CHLVU|nr:hypothetical protein D9Q98_006014 [Chlorella vulgaris]
MSLAAAARPVLGVRMMASRSPAAATAGQRAARVPLSARLGACVPSIASISQITGSSSSFSSSSRRQQQQRQHGRQQLSVSARARDPDALDDGGEQTEAANKEPPSLFWRCFAALCYLVPWIDSISLGAVMYAKFRNLLLFYYVPGPLASVYFGSQFAPLIIFFVMFLSIVKNTKLHHFVRFNCMQAIMLDIVVMLFHILRAYLPSELKWSIIGQYADMFGFTCCMATILYAVFWTVRGYYGDIPFVSESVYHQVQLSEYA